MDPFSTSVWVAILLSAVAMSLIFFLLGRFSPGEWGNPFPCVDEPNRCGKRKLRSAIRSAGMRSITFVFGVL